MLESLRLHITNAKRGYENDYYVQRIRTSKQTQSVVARLNLEQVGSLGGLGLSG